MNHHLFTLGNPKTMKGEAQGWLTAILHLHPGSVRICPWASAECIALCLNTAGRGGIGLDAEGNNTIQLARKRRTEFFLNDGAEFYLRICQEVEHWRRYAAKRELRLAVRINGTSDQPGFAGGVARHFAGTGVRFYDYTKCFGAWDRNPQVHYTFSRSELNWGECTIALDRGVNVAVVFKVGKGQPLPRDWDGYRVIDGDAHDLRFLDPQGSVGYVVGLRAKGRAKKATAGGFVVDVGD